MKSMIVFLILMVPKSSNIELLNNEKTRCSNSNDCQTWFICNNQKNCQCGDRHHGKIACDDSSQISAILECNCITYDEESKSTFLGSCFYNCESHYGVHKWKHHMVYQWLPEHPQILLNLSICAYSSFFILFGISICSVPLFPTFASM